MSEADDRLDFCRQALGEIGTRSTITSLDPPDGSTEAYYCGLFLDATRDQVLRAAHWNFAGRTEVGTLWKALPGTPENPAVPVDFRWTQAYPAPPWLYSYQWPGTSAIMIRRVREQGPFMGSDGSGIPLYGGISSSGANYNQHRCAQFEVVSDNVDDAGAALTSPVRVILTNAQNALIDFTTSDISFSMMDPLFGDAFMLAVEGKLALALLGDKALYQAKLAEANNSIREARVRDGNEGLTTYDHVPDWLQVRGVVAMPPPDWFYPNYGPLFAV